MNAYQRGLSEAGTRKDYIRTYETDKAENQYWKGYIAGMRAKLRKGEVLVQCTRDRLIFASAKSPLIRCPKCYGCYVKCDDVWTSETYKLKFL